MLMVRMIPKGISHMLKVEYVLLDFSESFLLTSQISSAPSLSAQHFVQLNFNDSGKM